MPPSFDSLKEAYSFIQKEYAPLFEKIDYAKKRSLSHLVSVKINENCYLPVLIEKSELVKYVDVFETIMLKEVEEHSKRFVVLNLPAAASLMFKPISNKKALDRDGFNRSGEFIIGIDLASGLPVSVNTVATKKLKNFLMIKPISADFHRTL